MIDRIEQLRLELADILEGCVRPLFIPGVKLTIAARFDGFPDRDVLVSDDSLDGVTALIERSKLRPEREGPPAIEPTAPTPGAQSTEKSK